MATVQEKCEVQEVLIEHDALRLLDCFQDGLDEVVKKIAEDVSRNRSSRGHESAMPLVVQISPQDVRDAAAMVSQLLQRMVTEGTVSAGVTEAIQSMNDCVSCQ